MIGFGPAGSTEPELGIPVPEFDAKSLNLRVADTGAGADTASGDAAPIVAVDVTDVAGKTARLVDFGSAGRDRTPYVTWLTLAHVKPTPFSRTTPLRSGRPVK